MIPPLIREIIYRASLTHLQGRYNISLCCVPLSKDVKRNQIQQKSLVLLLMKTQINVKKYVIFRQCDTSVVQSENFLLALKSIHARDAIEKSEKKVTAT